MAINAGSVYSELILDTGRYNAGLLAAERQLQAFGSQMEAMGKKMEKAGKALTTKVTAPIVALGTLSAKSAIDFESAFAGVRKTVDTSEAGFAKLEKGIRDMSKEIPASAVAISEVAEAAGQLGIETDNILGFSRVMIDMGEATNLSATDAASALAQFANITQMSQKDFDRLGSTIVALGNNLATTERDIVNMGMRLAGAGAQIGLSEAQIMAFSGALSSVGIEAEAGGSAFSKVMIDMQLAVETGKNGLQNFAKVAGMSSAEFQRAFREDAAGAIIAFIQGLSTAEERGMSAIKVLDDMDITEIRLRDSLLRAAGASNVFAGAVEMGSDAWRENIALTAEAEQRYKTTASQLQIAKNYLTDAGIIIGEIVVPHLVSLGEKIKNAAEWFSNLNPATQEAIVKLAALAAATGPLIWAGSKVTAGVGKVIGLLNRLTPATAATTTATTALGGGFNIAGAAARAGALLLNPWVLGLTAAGVGAYKLYKHLQEDAIPAVERFDESISEATQEVVGSFLDMEEQATMALNQLAWSGEEVTVEMAANITGAFSQMGQQVVSELTEQKEASLSQYREMFLTVEGISIEEQQRILELTEQGYNDRIKATEDGQARINEILRMAAEEGREITQGEYSQINLIKEQMVTEGIKVLSDGEQEQLAIMERLRQESGKISALQAAEIVQNSRKQMEEAITNAEQEYNDRLKYAAQLRAEGGAEAEALANKVGDGAKRQYDEAKENAKKMHEAVVVEAKAQAQEHVSQVDWETGEIKTKWQVMVGNVKQWYKEQQEESKRRNQLIKEQDEKLKAEQEQQWKELRQNLSNLGGQIKEDAKSTWETMRRNTAESWEKAKSDTVAKAAEIKTDITNKFDELVADAFNWGSNMLTMFTNGLNSKVGAVGEAIAGVATTVKKFLGFASPTEEGPAADSDQWAPNFMEMFAQGFKDNIPVVRDAVGEVAETVANMTDIAMQRLDVAFQHYQIIMQDTASTTEMMAAKQEYLQEKLSLLDKKLQDTQAELLTVSASKGVASIEAQQLALEVDKLSLEYAKLTKEIEAANKAAEKSKFGLSISNGKGVRSENVRMALDAAMSKGGAIDFNKVTQKWPKNAHGTNFFPGGLTWIGEQGRELVELPRGSKIHSNDKSERMAQRMGGDVIQNITINSPTPLSPSEIARKNLQVSRQLAMEWGM